MLTLFASKWTERRIKEDKIEMKANLLVYINVRQKKLYFVCAIVIYSGSNIILLTIDSSYFLFKIINDCKHAIEAILTECRECYSGA